MVIVGSRWTCCRFHKTLPPRALNCPPGGWHEVTGAQRLHVNRPSRRRWGRLCIAPGQRSNAILIPIPHIMQSAMPWSAQMKCFGIDAIVSRAVCSCHAGQCKNQPWSVSCSTTADQSIIYMNLYEYVVIVGGPQPALCLASARARSIIDRSRQQCALSPAPLDCTAERLAQAWVNCIVWCCDMPRQPNGITFSGFPRPH